MVENHGNRKSVQNDTSSPEKSADFLTDVREPWTEKQMG